MGANEPPEGLGKAPSEDALTDLIAVVEKVADGEHFRDPSGTIRVFQRFVGVPHIFVAIERFAESSTWLGTLSSWRNGPGPIPVEPSAANPQRVTVVDVDWLTLWLAIYKLRQGAGSQLRQDFVGRGWWAARQAPDGHPESLTIKIAVTGDIDPDKVSFIAFSTPQGALALPGGPSIPHGSYKDITLPETNRREDPRPPDSSPAPRAGLEHARASSQALQSPPTASTRSPLTGVKWAGLILANVLVLALVLGEFVQGSGVVREHCFNVAASNRSQTVQVDSKWTFVLWPPLNFSAIDPAGRCVRNSPAREALNATGVWALPRPEVQVVQHLRDQYAGQASS